jgi:hypothetical protein
MERVMAGAASIRRLSVPTGRPADRASHDTQEFGDRRRWTTFLTWAFVLAEMAGRDGLLPTSAHAGDEGLGRADHASGDAAPIANTLPNISVSTATESPEPITYQHAPTMPSYVPTPLSSELGEAKTVPVSDELAHDAGAAGGGASGHADVAPAAGAALFVAFSPAGESLDLGLSTDLGYTVENLLGRAADGLGGLPVVGGLLEDVGDTLAATTGNLLSTLSPVTSLLGLGGGHDDGTGIGSPGQISFAFGTPSEPTALMTEAGGYTGYGISLNLGSQDSHSGGDAGIEGTATLGGLDAFDHLSGMDHSSSSDVLHLDQAVLRTASDLLA